MKDGYYNPVYVYRDNKFIIMDAPCYVTAEQAQARVVGDGLELLCKDTDIGACTQEALFLPVVGKGRPLLLMTGRLHGVSIGVFEGDIMKRGEE